MDAPVPVIKIWKSSTVYYAVQNVVKLPIINRNENRAGSFSFSVTYDATVSTNILSTTFNGWSDSSTGAVDWGMRVTIDNVANGVTTQVAEGIISTITPAEMMVSFECADMLAVLGVKGAELHRNYYNSATYTGYFNAISGGSEGDDTVAVDISAISNAQGTPIDPINYLVEENIVTTTGSEFKSLHYEYTGNVNRSYSIRWDFNISDHWGGFIWRFRWSADVYAQVMFTYDLCDSNGTLIRRGITYALHYSGQSLEFDISSSFGSSVLAPGTYYVILSSFKVYTGGGIPRPSTDFDLFVKATTGSASYGTITYEGQTHEGKLRGFRAYVPKVVTAWTRNGNQLLITGITGVTIDSTTKPDLINPASNRANIPYTSGSIQTTEIMDHIKKVALDDNVNAVIDASAIGNSPSIGLFRTGGGYALDYLKALADIATPSGRQLTFSIVEKILHIGARRMESDNADIYVTEGSLNDPAMISLSLTKTIKGRPSRVMLRGTLSTKTDNKPIIAVLRNAALAASRGGIMTDTVISNSSALTAPDMIAIAYASVNTSTDGWEGTLVLSGIVPDIIDRTGAYAGSGKVINIVAPHSNVNNKFKVVAVTYDYDKLTTTVTLTNAKQIYSSDIAESVAEALTAGDMAVSSSGSDLYKTQFCYQYTSNAETTMATGNTVKIKTSDNVEYTLGDVAVYLLPNGRKLIYGAITITGSTSNAKYRVQYYQINGGAWREIPARDRCDAYNGQYVILNIDCPQ